MERYQVRTVKALLEDPETFSISTLALSTANRVTRTDCRQGDNLGASPTLACVNNEQVERIERSECVRGGRPQDFARSGERTQRGVQYPPCHVARRWTRHYQIGCSELAALWTGL